MQNQCCMNDKALEFALDRNACLAGATPAHPTGMPYIVANNVGDEISDYAHEPSFAGANYPIGGYF